MKTEHDNVTFEQPGLPSRALFALLLLVAAVSFYVRAGNFYVPDSDFFDYREKAIAYRHFTLPEHLKRPPMYSATIALVSLPLRGRDRELHAAEAINVVAALALLWFLYRLAARYLGQHAFWVAWLMAVSPVTVKMAVKPKAEIFTAALILGALLLHSRNDKKAYLAAFFAALTRYEGFVLVAALAASDLFFSRERWKRLGLGVLAGSGLLVWLLINHFREGTDNPYGMYFSHNRLFEGAGFVRIWLGALVPHFSPEPLRVLLALSVVVLAALGLWVLWTRDRRFATAVGLYLLGYLTLHSLYPFTINDYTVLANGLVWLLFMLGVVRLGELAGARLAISRATLIALKWSTVVSTLLLLLLLLWRKGLPLPETTAWILLLLAAGVTLFLAQRTVAWLVLPVFGLLLWPWGQLAAHDLYQVRYAKAEYRLIAEWLDENARPDEKAVLIQPAVVAYYTRHFPDENLLVLRDFAANDSLSFRRELAQKGVKYVVWDYHHHYRVGDTYYDWRFKHYKIFLVNALSDGKSRPGFRHLAKLEIGPRSANIYEFVPTPSDSARLSKQ